MPTLATSDALKSLDSHLDLLYVGQAGGMEAKIVAASGYEFVGISAGKFRRNFFDRNVAKLLNPATLGPNLRDIFRIVHGLGQAMRVLRRFAPDVVFLKGGFVCLPVGLAAHLLRIPYVIHESDVTPGLTNRVLARWAAKIAVGFPVKHYSEFATDKLVYVGNPIRSDILKAHRLEGLAHFGLTDQLPVVLITGGSQGAAQINTAVIEGLEDLVSRYQVLHVTGEHELGRVQFALRHVQLAHPERYQAHGFLMKDMSLALAAADVIVGRAGVNTINDSAALAKPTILIPNSAMAGHQVDNAKVMSRAGAVRVLKSDTLTGAGLVREIRAILDDESVAQGLSQKIAAFARPTAARDLAEIVLSQARVQKPNIEVAS